ncbi:MAG: hypothetical protein K2L55_06765 [Muribaculaceae bacterium]|nr:hypothetical protein [Muribaculaceae bacterium]
MKRILFAFAALIMLSALSVKAAMFTPSPMPLQESSKNVVLTFNAAESGVAGLQGLSTDLYVHIGVNTNLSPDSWTYTSKWGDNAEKYKLKRTAANTFQLTLGDLRTYFGVTNAAEHITKICIIARNAAGNVQTSDQFIEVYPEGLYVSLTTSPASTTITKATEITFTASATQSANLKIYVDDKEVKSASNATTLTYTQTFSTPGVQNNVKAVASNSNGTKEVTVPVLYVKASEQQNYPGGTPKQGAVKNADGSVTFCIAAPGKSSVIIVGSWDNYQALSTNTMKYQDYNGYRYFWHTVKGLDNSTYYPYYYLVDGKYKVSDPYAHLVLDHLSDKWLEEDVFADRPRYPYSQFDDTMLAVYKGDMHDTYNWKVKNFKVTNPNSLVIYELLFRDFTGTSNTADGTIRKAIDKIPYLNELGVSAVELMPVMEFDGNNSWGYNTNSYMALDKSYGSPDDLKEFIDKCHQCGIAVILDIVFNHTPGLHPWYAMYDAGTSPFYNKTAPHDYSVYEDIRQEYPLVEQHWVDVLTHWLTNYKVDGFRFDLVKGLGDSNSYGKGTEAYNQSRIDRMIRLHAAMKKVNPNVIHINELLASAEEEKPLGNDGQYQWNNQNGNAINYVSKKAANLRYFNSAECSRPVCSTVDYAQSHDEQWVGFKANKTGVGATTRCKLQGSMAAQLMMSPGPKMIWQFDELGYDYELKDGLPRTDPKPIPPASYYNSPARKGLMQNYTDLNWMRRSNPEMFDKDVTPVYTGFNQSTGARSIRLTKGDKEIIAFINPGSSNATVTVSATKLTASNSNLLSASKDFTPTLNGTGTSVSVSVPANSYCVYATKAVAGVEDVITDEIGGNNCKVYGGQGEIIIEGEYNNVAVYNMSGMMMPSLNVASGLYIVNVDGQVTKVLVK